MANFYTDNTALKHYLAHPLMEKIVTLKERDFADAGKYDYAPLNHADAIDSYDKVLEIVGDICANRTLTTRGRVSRTAASSTPTALHATSTPAARQG